MGKKGFTLIELMIVVVIIGIVAAIALPPLLRSTITSQRTAMLHTLLVIYDLENEYHYTHFDYAGDGFCASKQIPQGLGIFGPTIPGWSKYEYCINTYDDGKFFKATATANLDNDTTLDIWQIDQTRSYHIVSDDQKN